ncbi:MAG: RNA polymerase sigma factor, partial [Eubacterium sp.]
DQLQDGASFKSWLIRIAYSQCINFINSNWRYDPEGIEADEVVDPVSETNPATHYLESERSQIVMDCIQSLPHIHRSVILFKYYEGLRIKDIALIMDCSEGTVKSRLNAAKKSLDFLLKNQGITTSFWGLSPMLSAASVAWGLPANKAQTLVEGIADTGHFSANFKAVGVAKGVASVAPLIATVTTVTVLGGGMVAVDTFVNPEPSVVETQSPPAAVSNIELPTNYGQTVPISVNIDHPESLATAYLKAPDGSHIPLSLAGNVLTALATENGSYTIVIEDKNGESTTQSLAVTTVDTETPVITDYKGEDEYLTIQLADSQSGIDAQTIYAKTQSGTQFSPESASETQAVFKMPAETCTVYYSDKAGNIGHTLVKSRDVSPEPAEGGDGGSGNSADAGNSAESGNSTEVKGI